MREYLSPILMAFLVATLFACAGPTAQAEIDWTGLEVAEAAREMLGTPYCYGGVTEKGFDCSGLVRYAHSRAGLEIPRTAANQYEAAIVVDLANLQPGDVLFFRSGNARISHGGIYIGNDRFIHAPSGGKRVGYGNAFAPNWRRQLAGAGRFY